MGSYIEFNDTLQLTTEQGFPRELDLQQHLNRPIRIEDIQGKMYTFHNKPGLRLFHPAPLRCFLVHNINGKWLYWGHCHVIEQTIHATSKTTSGKFIITKLYSPGQQRLMSTHEVDDGKEFFDQE